MSFAALQHRDFRLLWIGQLISFSGTMMQTAAVLWHVSVLAPPGRKGLALGAVGLVRVVPIVTFSLLSGVVSDAVDRRRLMILTQSAMTVLSAVLAVVTFRGLDALWPIYLLSALGSAAGAFDGPARQALIPALVPRRDLPNAIGLNTIACLAMTGVTDTVSMVDEIPTWGTPTIFSAAGRDELVTNGTKIRGYDPATGNCCGRSAPTPSALPKGSTSSATIAWSNDREGTYIPPPLVYRDLLYTLNNNGILTVYDAKSGERAYRTRVGTGGSFSASPVAADGRLYIANEDGDVYVIKAGREYVELAKNPMGEVIMATPAISDGVVLIRTLQHVYAMGS
jgi:hypothetical protein